MKGCTLTLLILLTSFLGAEDTHLTADEKAHNAIAYSFSNESKETLKQSWKPYFLPSCKLQPNQEATFQFNVGLGFLYFGGLRGDLSGQPAADLRPWNYTPIEGSLKYNRTPLYESLLGYRFNQWIKLALSYQYQGGVTVTSKMQNSRNPTTASVTPISVYSQFQSNLSINSLLAKVYFQLPKALIWNGFSTTPYIALGVGPAWQSWTRVHLNRNYVDGGFGIYLSEPQFLRQKISANAAWTIDAGLKVQKQTPFSDFSLIAGCKYNEWGQARSIGKMSQQGNLKVALAHPVKVKTLYSFAPYLGVQWNFGSSSPSNFQIKGKSPNTFKPYFAATRSFQAKKAGFANFNVGPTFLYFSKVRGNLFGRPDDNFGIWGDVPLRGLLSINKVPLFEALWGYKFNPWISAAFSFQHLTGMTIQTRMLNGTTLSGSTGASDYSQFQANLAYNSAMAKVIFELPWAMIWKNVATTPYFGAAVGPSWQSWTRIQINRTDRDPVGYNSDVQPIRQKIMANAAYLIDIGFRMQNVQPNHNFSVTLGCKYNQWGQARNIGLLTQQGGMIKGLNHPFRIKMLYSFTPYLGAQWNFPISTTSKKPYKLNNRLVNTFKPFWTTIDQIQAKKSPFTQFNVGLGLLYFNKIQGSLAGQPASFFEIYGPVPIKEDMIYNRSPLFEYLVGYRFNQWFKMALSYQHQGGISFQTQILDAMAPNLTINTTSVAGHYSQFQANVALDALMAKFYFELPYPMIFKGIGTTPYLAVGVGPSWQSWTRIQINRMYDTGTFVGEPQNLRQKISANCAWMLDAGFRIQSAYPCSPFSVLFGCKYNEWGQARSMGKVSQQDGIREGLWKPVHIKTVYSFAPYIGMQWNF